MLLSDYPEHYCLVIFAQDQWKEQFKDDFGTSIRPAPVFLVTTAGHHSKQRSWERDKNPEPYRWKKNSIANVKNLIE